MSLTSAKEEKAAGMYSERALVENGRPLRVLLTNYHGRSKTTYYRPGYFGRELARRGYAVTVLCTSDRRRRSREIKEDRGVRYVEAPDWLWGKLRTGWDARNLLDRMRFLQRENFDIVHSFESRPATIYPVLRYLRRRPGPLIMDWIDWWGRGGLIREHRPWWYQILFGRVETWFEEHFRTRAHATTVISRALRDRAVGLGVDPASIFHIPNGAPVDEVQPVERDRARSLWGIPRDAFVLADAARDVTLGVDVVFRGVAEAAKSLPHIFMLMTGSHAARLTRLAETCGLRGRFRHLGTVPFDRLPEALSCADAFAMAYPDCVANRGRWPGRMGMFLALGRPVVSSPVGDVEALLHDSHCGILTPHSAAGFAAAFRQMASSPSSMIEMGRRARVTAESMSWGKMTDRLELCYAEALARFREQ
jgi:glycosyltransferase involved in cell wall biosynthesis